MGAGADAAFVLSLNDDDHDHHDDGDGGRNSEEKIILIRIAQSGSRARLENWCMI